jgi:hypothetical protein
MCPTIGVRFVTSQFKETLCFAEGTPPRERPKLASPLGRGAVRRDRHGVVRMGAGRVAGGASQRQFLFRMPV